MFSMIIALTNYYRNDLKFDRHIGSSAADVSVKFQSDRTILNTNLMCLNQWYRNRNLTNIGYPSPPRRTNSLTPTSAYMGKSWLVQLTACCLFYVKPLSEPVLTYCQLDPKKKFSMKFKSFHSGNCTRKFRLHNDGHFFSRANSICTIN